MTYLYSSSVYAEGNSRPVPGARVTVIKGDDGTLAVLTDASGNPLSNPVITDINGAFSFYADQGVYDLDIYYNGRKIAVQNDVQLGPGGSAGDFTLRTDLAAPGGVDLVNGAASEADLATKASSSALAAPTGVNLIGGAVAYSPSNPYSLLRNGYSEALREWDAYWWNPAGYLKHTATGGTNFGIPDASVTYFSMWQMVTGFTVYYEAWRIAAAAGDTVTATFASARIMAQWVHVKATYGVQALKRGDNSTGGTWVAYTIDDAVLYARFLRMVSEVYGPTTTEGALALTYLIEFIPFTTNFYRDQRSANAIIDYGVSTPDGTSFRSNTRGALYPHPGDSGSFAFYQYGSSAIEAGLAVEALWAAAQTATPAALKTAFRSYAANTWAWINQYLRTPAPSDSSRTVQGIYAATLLLDVNVNANNDSSVNGGAAATGAYQTQEAYLQPFHGWYGKPVRQLTHVWDAATQLMGILSYELGVSTGSAAYTNEALSIAAAYCSSQGYGRIKDGLPLIGNLQDPHSQIFWSSFLRKLGNISGFDRTSLVIRSTINTAKKLLISRVRGLIDGNWGGEELNPANGTYTWEDSLGLQGGNGAGQGKREQIMVSGSGLNMVQAAIQFADQEVSLGSGITPRQAIEAVPLLISAQRTGGQESMTRSGGTFTAGISIRSTAYTMDLLDFADGAGPQPTLQWNYGKTIDRVNYANANREFWISGVKVGYFGAGTYGFCSYGALRPSNSTTVAFMVNGAGNAQLYVANDGSAYQYDLTNGYHQFYRGATEVFRANLSGVASFGALSAQGVIQHGADNTWAFGGPSNRATRLYAADATINTSDAREKTWVGGFSSAQLAAAKEIAAAIGWYKWNKAIAAKGANARFHCGVEAQTVWAIMVKHGLIDAASPTTATSIYGFLCYDKWGSSPATPDATEKDDKGNVIRITKGSPAVVAGDRYGIVYDELHSFLIAAQEQRLLALEAA